MLGESLRFEQTSPSEGELFVSGYLRGDRPLSANQLVHLTGLGDFQIRRILGNMRNNTGHGEEKTEGENEQSVLQERDESVQEDLSCLRELDTFATVNDQSIFTEEETKELEESYRKRRAAARSAKSVWDEIVSDDEHSGPEMDGMSEVGDMDGPAEGEEDDIDGDVVSKRKLERDEVHWPDEVETPYDIRASERFAKYRGLKSVKNSEWNKFANLPLEYSRIYSFENFRHTMKRVMGEPHVAAFDDEVSKRGAMDQDDYNFTSNTTNTTTSSNTMDAESTSRDEEKEKTFTKEDDTKGPLDNGGIPSGRYVTVQLANVPLEAAEQIAQNTSAICLWGLLEYEHKVSVLHFLVRRLPEDADQPIKQKEPMEFHCGFRRFVARPIYSDNTKADKHITDRFFQKNRFCIASVYARIQFPPSSVLMFRATPPEGIAPSLNPLVADGTLDSIDPHRMLIKRIILSGNPISVNKRAAVVRYMFFDPEDIRYFQKVELRTKKGLTGHIREPRGTKGYMKCLFDGFIQNNDTVCMNLYKRQYPPFNPEDFGKH